MPIKNVVEILWKILNEVIDKVLKNRSRKRKMISGYVISEPKIKIWVLNIRHDLVQLYQPGEFNKIHNRRSTAYFSVILEIRKCGSSKRIYCSKL